jgi:23S rRNA (guanine745-N1)-methyltransferase
VPSLAPRLGLGLLRCPICRLDFHLRPSALQCPNRHSFDIAREGYVNLLGPVRRPPAAGGDTAQQLQHRAAFLAAGHFDAVAATILEDAGQTSTLSAGHRWHVIDAGCGTAYHLARIASLAPASMVGLGLDIATEAVRRGARAWAELAFAVTESLEGVACSGRRG